MRAPCLLHVLVSRFTRENAAGGSGESASLSSPNGSSSGVPGPWRRLPAGARAVPEEPAVGRGDVVERRDGHEEVPPVAPGLVLGVAPLVARVGVGEGVTGPVVRREAPEELRRPGLAPDAPADLGGAVEDGPPRHAARELEHVAEPLADALRGLAPEHLGGPHVGVREGGGRVLAPGGHAADPEVRLPEVGLDLAGQPARRKEALGVPAVALPGHLLAAAPGVAARG